MSKRKYKCLGNGIFRVETRDKKNKKWIEPQRGKRFSVRKTLPNGKRVQYHFENFDEAKKFKDGHIALDRKPKDNILFDQLQDEWTLNFVPHLAISTQIRYKSYLQHFEFFRGMRVCEITSSIMDGYLRHIKSKEYLSSQNSTRQSYRHEFSVLRSILNHYISRFNREYNLPFLPEHNRMLKVKEGKARPKDLTLEEFYRFMAALRSDVVGDNEQIYYLACLQYGLCARVQEAAALTFEDFDLESRLVTIRQKIVWPRGKNYESFVQAGLKASECKKIPLSEFARKHFLEWIMKSKRRAGLIFNMNGKPLSYRQIEYRYNRALKKANLPFTGTHILRHGSLTELYSVTGDIKVVSKFAGHSNAKVTEVYAKVRESHMAEATLRLDEKMKSVGASGGKADSNLAF